MTEMRTNFGRNLPTRRAYTITLLRRDPEHGFWTAHVSVDGQTFDVDRRYGSWMASLVGERRYDIAPEVAAELQRRVRAAERAEGRNSAYCEEVTR